MYSFEIPVNTANATPPINPSIVLGEIRSNNLFSD
jgi:hypothetical protein